MDFAALSSGILDHFPYLGLFLLLVLGGMGLPFPEDSTLILCGFLIAGGVVSPVRALLASYAGLILADLFLYFMGRRYGRMVVTHPRFGRLLPPEKLARLEERFRKRGVLVVAAGRHLVGLRAQILLAAGVLRMPAGRFIAVDAFSAIFSVALMVGLGYLGGNSLDIFMRDAKRIEHLLVASAVLAVALILLFRYFRSRRRERH